MDATCRTGKIGSIPADIRRELNVRLYNGEKGPRLLAWLNEQPDVKRIMEEQWNSEPVSASNLSEWRGGGYKDFLRRQETVENTKALSQWALDLAKAAGGDLAAGPSAIAAGKLLSFIEDAGEDRIDSIVAAISTLRKDELQAKSLSIKEKQVQETTKANNLAQLKFYRETARLFLEWFEDKRAREIAQSADTKDVKMDRIIEAMFGKRPEHAQ
jgi:hypothetical protein